MLLLLLFLFPVVAVAELGRDKLFSILQDMLMCPLCVLSSYMYCATDGVCDAAAAALPLSRGGGRRVGTRRRTQSPARHDRARGVGGGAMATRVACTRSTVVFRHHPHVLRTQRGDYIS